MAHDSTGGCDMLIWAEDPANHPFATGRARGQVVDIKDCPHKGWGNEESPNGEYRMKVIHVPDKIKADLEYLLEQLHETWPNSIEDDALEMPLAKKKFALSKYRIDITALKQAEQDVIMKDNNQYCNLNFDIFSGQIVDDTDHPELVKNFPERDRSSKRIRRLAYIRLRLIKLPTDWQVNKSMFDHIDTEILEGALFAAMEI